MNSKSFVIGGVVALIAIASLSVIYIPSPQLGSLVGMTSSVDVNSYNATAEQLRIKELALAQREQDLVQKEGASTAIPSSANGQNKLLWLSIVIGAGVLVLVLLNFYLDWKRSKPRI